MSVAESTLLTVIRSLEGNEVFFLRVQIPSHSCVKTSLHNNELSDF